MEDKDVNDLKGRIKYYMYLAFLAGRWRGQADLETSMDNDFFGAFLQSMQARKSGGAVSHAFTLPNTFDIVKGVDGFDEMVNIRPDFDSKYALYKLRSDEWRLGVLKTTEKDFYEAVDGLVKEVTQNSIKNDE